MITVFTPTYNRADLLTGLYNSLCKQKCQQFEWIIVDDGSTDDTKTVVDKMLNEQERKDDSFQIRYFYKENGGKHTAINRGVQEAKGDLFLILDSDDELPEKSIKNISVRYEEIINDDSFGGICGLMAHRSGESISTFPEKVKETNPDFIDCSEIDLRYKYHFQGDLCEVFKTSVLREFPFPEYKGERFCPEALVWNRIALKYKLRTFNDVIYYRDYLDDGLTSKIVKIRMDSPMASMVCYSEMCRCNLPFVQKLKAAINYWRFEACSDCKDKLQIGRLWLCAKPIGRFMHKRDVANLER